MQGLLARRIAAVDPRLDHHGRPYLHLEVFADGEPSDSVADYKLMAEETEETGESLAHRE